jgi:3-hydroxyisobutyrate dehydrogenase-like beta-hydroxyacid dehydrogenase
MHTVPSSCAEAHRFHPINVLVGDFAPRFSIALSRKDLGLAARLAESLGVPMLTTSTVRQVYEAAAAAGLDGQDMAAVTALFERWAGVQVRRERSASP